MNINKDLISKVLLWKLGIIVEQNEESELNLWQKISSSREFNDMFPGLYMFLSDLWGQVIKYNLEKHPDDEKDEILESLWTMFLNWLNEDKGPRTSYIHEVIVSAIPPPLPPLHVENGILLRPITEVNSKTIEDESSSSGMGVPEENSMGDVEIKTEIQEEKKGSNSSEISRPQRSEDGSPPVTSHWKYVPVPDEPDKHDEYDNRSGVSPEGMKIIASRVRGKKHKHEGTNCDDWFDFAVSGPWTVFAISDGAGSCKFSRVGARAACEEAVKSLSESLRDVRINIEGKITSDFFKRDQNTRIFVREDLKYIQEVIHKAMVEARKAVEKSFKDRENSLTHFKLLGGRDLQVKDLSSTLLLAVHATIDYEGKDLSFVMACQIGDGMVSLVDAKGSLHLLGVPDSGEFAGETEFLTSKGTTNHDKLMTKTFTFLGPIRCLTIMTDGVADDYYPNNPELLRLYGDLVLYKVVDIQGSDESEIQSALSGTNFPTLKKLKDADFYSRGEEITAGGVFNPSIPSVLDYAKELGVPLTHVVASPALLKAGTYGKLKYDECSTSERLQKWLDSYHVRGSFDDRTLAILYKENIK